jgi:hypothetical protein
VGFNPELTYPPLALLMALDLREGRYHRAAIAAGQADARGGARSAVGACSLPSPAGVAASAPRARRRNSSCGRSGCAKTWSCPPPRGARRRPRLARGRAGARARRFLGP